MSEINLLSRQKDIYTFRARLYKVVRITSIVSLVIVSFASLSLFILKLTSPVADLKKQENSLLTSLSLSKKQIATLLLLHDRLKNISAILSARVSFEKTIDTILQKLPPSVTVDTMAIGKGKVSLVASSPSLLQLNAFIDGLTQLSNSNNITTTTLENLIVDEKTGRYISSVELILR